MGYSRKLDADLLKKTWESPNWEFPKIIHFLVKGKEDLKFPKIVIVFGTKYGKSHF